MFKIKEICRSLGIKPSKRKGQNFLIDPIILEKIISAAELKKEDLVLEIGSGFGILTEELAKRAGKVVAVELDKRLLAYLKEKFANQKNIKIIQGDILKIANCQLPITNYHYKLVANLPYNITGAVLRKFLSEKPKPKLIVLMLQKEVAERVVEKNKKSSIISLMVNFYGKPEIISYVSKNNFWPRPKVDSAILKISRIGTNLPPRETDLFFKIIKVGFSSPRKQLINNLSKILAKEKIKEIFEELDLELKIRAEDLNLKNWLNLYNNLYKSIYGEKR